MQFLSQLSLISSTRSALTNSANSTASYSDRSLRMTSMEKLHWFDRDPQFPNFVFATLRFTSRIDPQVARQSLAIALQRQPLASMEPKLIGGRWCWRPLEDQQLDGERVFRSLELRETEQVSGIAAGETDRDYVSYFLTLVNFSESKSVGDTVSEVRFHSHHAASDGVASIGLINDWLMVYNNLIAGNLAETGLVELDATSFQNRGVLGLLSWNFLKGLPWQAIALFGAVKFIFRKTSEILPESVPTETSKPFPAILGAWVEEDALEADRRRANDNQVGFAAWCLAKCFVALDSWSQTRVVPSSSTSQQKATSLWRILLPISTRSRRDRASVAANRTAIVQIDRQPPVGDDGDLVSDELISFSQSIDYEINFIRRWQLEKMFLIVIRLASFSNSWLSKVANNPRSRGAALFTHLGRPFKRAMIHVNRLAKSIEPGSLARPIDFELAGPVRSGTPINISFARFDGRLKICLHYDACAVSPNEADRLLATIVNLFSN